MNNLKFFAIVLIILSCTRAQGIDEKKVSPRPAIIPLALSWYNQWHMLDSTVGSQACRGKRSGNRVVLACDPMDAVVIVDITANGLCQVRFMRAGGGLPELSIAQSERTPTKLFSGCVEFPSSDGDFAFRAEPVTRETDLNLSRRAAKAASSYLSVWPQRCEAFFPLISGGDPFFHVYVVCDGVLNAVLEFRILNGKPAEFSHWDYTRKGANLPEGSLQRLGLPRLWLNSSVVGPGVSQ